MADACFIDFSTLRRARDSEGRKVNAERGSRQGRVIECQSRVIALDNVLDHRQTDPLPRVLAVQTLAALQNPRTLVGRHARTVILDTDFYPRCPIAIADAHFTQTEPVGVLQQVAEQFETGALLNRYMAAGRDVVGDPYRFIAINLVQGAAQAVQHWPELDLMPHQATLAQAGALELITDLLVHALDLTLQNPRLLTLLRTLRHALAHA